MKIIRIQIKCIIIHICIQKVNSKVTQGLKYGYIYNLFNFLMLHEI